MWLCARYFGWSEDQYRKSTRKARAYLILQEEVARSVEADHEAARWKQMAAHG